MSSTEVEEVYEDIIPENPIVGETLNIRAQSLWSKLKDIEKEEIDRKIDDMENNKKEVKKKKTKQNKKMKETSEKSGKSSILPYLFIILVFGIFFCTYYFAFISK